MGARRFQSTSKTAQKKWAIGDCSHACDKRIALFRNDVWTWDFIYDRTIDGRQLKFLVILDEFTREHLCLEVRRSFTADATIGVLSDIMDSFGCFDRTIVPKISVMSSFFAPVAFQP
ncbi:MAG: hypothetical protein WCX86_07315 [Candidatus Hydrogenedentales bacterium]